MLELSSVDTFYGETQALFAASLEVRRGEAVALLGANGAGKTTTLRSILGLSPAKRGAIRFAGKDITRSATHDIARAGIGWVPDDRRIFPSLDVKAEPPARQEADAVQELERKAGVRAVSRARILTRPRVRKPFGRRDANGRDWSSIARRPWLDSARRAVAGLAPKLVRDVMTTIRRLTQENLGVLVVEQNVESVLAVCDRAYVVRHGAVVHESTARALLDDESVRRELLGS
jgi:branched-chain amino acid transport system ATP-binding protein